MPEQPPVHTVEYLERVAHHGFDPKGFDARGPGTETPLPDGVFGPADLFDPALYPAVEFAMPGGKRVWVHPGTVEHAAWIAGQVARERRRAATDEDDGGAAQFTGLIYQVICCCRAGPEPTSRQVFGPEHAETIRRNLSWETVKAICDTSDRLGGENARYEAGLADFFDATRHCFETCASRLTTDSVDSCREYLEACASTVSRMSARNREPAKELRALTLEG